MIGLTNILCTGRGCPFSDICARATSPPKKPLQPLMKTPYDGEKCDVFLANEAFVKESIIE